jgi:hypothetical protein
MDLCRQCHKLAPFCFYDNSTSIAIGRTLIQAILRDMSPVKAQGSRGVVGTTSQEQRARSNWLKHSMNWHEQIPGEKAKRYGQVITAVSSLPESG